MSPDFTADDEEEEDEGEYEEDDEEEKDDEEPWFSDESMSDENALSVPVSSRIEPLRATSPPPAVRKNLPSDVKTIPSGLVANGAKMLVRAYTLAFLSEIFVSFRG